MSKRAIDARRWRATATEKRRFNKVLNAYVLTKHNDIYQEVKLMYDRLNEKYPNKNDLTKTSEWKTWKLTNTEEWKIWKKNTHTSDESDDDDGEQTTTADEEQTTTTVDEEQTTTAGEEQTTTVVDEEQATTAVEPATNGDENIEIPMEEPIAENGDENIEMPMEEPIAENDDENVEMPMEEPIPENDMNMDDIINGIIQDLQQDEDLQNILNADFVQPHYADEDEGIGLKC